MTSGQGIVRMSAVWKAVLWSGARFPTRLEDPIRIKYPQLCREGQRFAFQTDPIYDL